MKRTKLNTKAIEKKTIGIGDVEIPSERAYVPFLTIETLLIGNGDVEIPTERAYSPFFIKDGHNDGDKLIACYGLFILNDGEVSLMVDAPIYCLNAVELEEGGCILSPASNGGSIRNNTYTGWYDTYPVVMLEFENEAEMASWMEANNSRKKRLENQE